MDTSTSGTSAKSAEAIFDGLIDAISSPESEDGKKPCGSPAGQKAFPSGLEAVHASHSARPENGRGTRIRAMSGLNFAA